MQWLWTWGGKSFGYRDNDNLFTHFGKHIGKFSANEIYDVRGKYLGELINDDRLISDTRKRSFLKHPFAPYAGSGYAKYADYAGYAIYAGHEDFPSPETFK